MCPRRHGAAATDLGADVRNLSNAAPKTKRNRADWNVLSGRAVFRLIGSQRCAIGARTRAADALGRGYARAGVGRDGPTAKGFYPAVVFERQLTLMLAQKAQKLFVFTWIHIEQAKHDLVVAA